MILIHDVLDANQCFQKKWEDRLVYGTSNLFERYRAKKLTLHLHFGIGGVNGAQFCAVFQHALAGKGNERFVPLAASGENFEVFFLDKTAWNDTVLVGVIKIVEHPQGMLVCGSSALKWLTVLDDCLRPRGNMLYRAMRAGFVLVRALKDRKLGLSSGCFAIRQYQLPDQMIQCGTQLICNFTGKQEKLNRWVSDSHVLGKKTNDSCLNVWLGSRAVGVSFKVGSIPFEFIDVMYGAFNLGGDPI